MNDSSKAWRPDFLFRDGTFKTNSILTCDASGAVGSSSSTPEEVVQLKNRALLPGMVNAHSHAFQRVIRGRTEHRTTSDTDSFWTWRESMYSAAMRLSPEDIYDASRMAFLEMALSGITSVGEFHYLHHDLNGRPYDDPNLLAREVVRAANDVGLRIALLRVAYARSGFQTDVNPQQARFIETDPDVFLENTDRLASDLKNEGKVWVGIAPHSVRAVPLAYLKEVIGFANERGWPIHMHVAEQPAEVNACIEEYGRSPVALLASEGLLSDRFTGVHMIHVTAKAIGMIAEARAHICVCPTTERNLGDGIAPVDEFFKHDVDVGLGTDSQIQIDLLEDARELEYHLRLQKLERAILGPRGEDSNLSALAALLFKCATLNGARSIGLPGGTLDEGNTADFFTVDLNDPSIAGCSHDDLLAAIVFSMSRTAVKDVVIGGRQIVTDGKHDDQEEIVARFNELQRKLWD